MKAAGIICEFNPFHNGHKYLFDMVRQDINPDALVCVMSGNFVQRGEPAFWDKYTRAKMAISCGADLVIELPAIYAVNSAKEFALGGIEILNSLGCITHYCFGSESGNIEELKIIAEKALAEDTEFSTILKRNLDEGISYPKAYKNALFERFSLDLSTDISDPNNILAVEYIKSAIKLNSLMKPYCVKRTVSHDSEDTNGNISSASNMRKLLTGKYGLENIMDFYPSDIRDLISDHFDYDESYDRLFSLIRYNVLRKTAYDIANILEVNEGLENKIKKVILEAENLEDLKQSVKSKRYTYARVSRILMQIILELTKDDFEECKKHPYARVLAFNEKGKDLLKEFKATSSIPVLTNLNKQEELTKDLPGLKYDYWASNLYSIISDKTIYENSDKVCNSLPLNI